jgi:hypothetical protein
VLNDELNQRSPHDQDPPAQTPLAAHGVRRRRAVPIIQLSRATIASIALALLAAVTFGVGFMQLRHWDAGMTTNQGQRALADFITTAALGVLFALGAMLIWGASIILGKMASNHEEARAWQEELRGWTSAQMDATSELGELMLEQYTALARLVGKQELLNEEHRERIALAMAEFRIQVGQITHRVEQAEAVATGSAKAADGLRHEMSRVVAHQETLAELVASGSGARIVLDISSEDAYELGKRVGEGGEKNP